jgi:hypothetical protein
MKEEIYFTLFIQETPFQSLKNKTQEKDKEKFTFLIAHDSK